MSEIAILAVGVAVVAALVWLIGWGSVDMIWQSLIPVVEFLIVAAVVALVAAGLVAGIMAVIP